MPCQVLRGERGGKLHPGGPLQLGLNGIWKQAEPFPLIAY